MLSGGKTLSFLKALQYHQAKMQAEHTRSHKLLG